MIDYKKINWYNSYSFTLNKQGIINNSYYGYDKDYFYFIYKY